MAFVYRAQINSGQHELADISQYDFNTTVQAESPKPHNQTGKQKKSTVKGLACKKQGSLLNQSFQEPIEQAKVYGATFTKHLNNKVEGKENQHQSQEIRKKREKRMSKGSYFFKSAQFKPIESNQENRETGQECEVMGQTTFITHIRNSHQIRKGSGNKSLTLLKARQQASLKLYTPSIPSKLEKYGYVVREGRMNYPQLIHRKERFEGVKENMPGPSDYQPCLPNKVKGIIRFQGSAGRQKNEDAELTETNSLPLVDDRQALHFHNQQIKSWIREGKQSRKSMIKLHRQRSEINTVKPFLLGKRPNSSQSSENETDSQYEPNATPGPGEYTYNNIPQKKSFRSNKEKYHKIFFVQSNRFKDDKHLQKGLNSSHQYRQQFVPNDWDSRQKIREKVQKKNRKFYISLLSRKIELQREGCNPPPGHYEYRSTMEYDAMSKMMKNSSKLIDNNIPRLAPLGPADGIGPGSYEIKIPDFKPQKVSISPNSQKLSFQNPSSQSALQKAERELLLAPQPQKKLQRIHNSVCLATDEHLQVPFMAKCPKGLSFARSQDTTYVNTSDIQALKAIKQNHTPFNSSTIRNSLFAEPSAQNTNLGLYDLSNCYEWNKKSFNILFH